MILGFPDSHRQAAAVAQALALPYVEVGVHHFPDGESRITLPECSGDHIVVVRSLDRPNDKLVEVLLLTRALRERGVLRLTLVAPYLCYMRQDKAFHKGELISQKLLGAWIAETFEDVITVDPHLHRIDRLDDAVPAKNAVAISAAPLFARHLQELRGEFLVLGPDAESGQWVRAIAEPVGFPYAVAKKRRHGDREVDIELPRSITLRGRSVVLVDDVASSGSTLIKAVEKVTSLGAEEVRVLVTHPVFAGNAVDELYRHGVAAVGSSDSIVHPTNCVALAPILSEALRALL